MRWTSDTLLETERAPGGFVASRDATNVSRVAAHQRVHFFTGFIGVPSGHPKLSANCGKLTIGPITLCVCDEKQHSTVCLLVRLCANV